MAEDKLLKDEEIKTIARSVIRDVIQELEKKGKFDPKISIVENEGIIEFIYKTTDGNASIHYNPQKRVEEILRETEKLAIEYLKDEVPPEHFYSAISGHLYSSDEDIEIKALIENFPSTFKTAFSKLEDASKKLSSQVEEKLEAFIKKVKEQDEEKIKDFARKVDELKPLWTYITNYFKEHDYESNCVCVVSEDKFKELAKGIELPEYLLRLVFDRQEKLSKDNPELQPHGFALKHAQKLVNMNGKYDNLEKKYRNGINLIKEDTEFFDQQES